jgi:hypothetical protein
VKTCRYLPDRKLGRSQSRDGRGYVEKNRYPYRSTDYTEQVTGTITPLRSAFTDFLEEILDGLFLEINITNYLLPQC